eukprot:GHVP01015570.1.p1 GENE.GHVP01015570.1~~GHVP01015570.1.p1  ORF type:complete len:908 (+),score=190.76 GHVP01015570.1:352-2724(+)
MTGFYLSTYKTSDGIEKKIATTQFEPADARRAFPCFDEPEMKAAFEISITAENKYTMLSNMDIKEEIGLPSTEDKKTVHFNKTPISSTYLIAFIIGELEHIETKTNEGVLIRCFTTQGVIKQAEYALDVASKCLSIFTRHFEIPYPLPKLDLVAIPDFSFGAMENWGLITYRLTALLFDSEKSSIAAKQRVAYVVCHELAHQWFGNLVTMKWWDDLWLNEGFATWAGWLAVDEIHPEWDIWASFSANDYARALSLDSMFSTHPILVPVHSPHDISEIFDAISYQKGASLIRMLANHMGIDKFIKGVCNYLKKHSYGNAVTNDLWMELNALCLENDETSSIMEMMKNWTLEGGYPVVSIKKEGKKICLSQKRFLMNRERTLEEGPIWNIPLKFTTKSGKNLSIIKGDMMCDKEIEKDYVFESSEDFIKVNSDQTTFIRVIYDNEMISRIERNMRDSQTNLTDADKAGLLSDLFASAKAGQGKLESLFGFLRTISRDRSYFVWSTAISILTSIYSIFWEQDEEFERNLKTYFYSSIEDIVEIIGFEDRSSDSSNDVLLRTTILSFAASVDDPKLSNNFQECFNRFLEGDETAIPNNLLLATFEFGIRNGTKTEHDAVFEYYQRRDIPSDRKIAALSALGASKDWEIIEKALSWTVDTSKEAVVRGQDAIFILGSISRNHKFRNELWDFVKANWSKYQERFTGSSIPMLNHIISICGSYFTSNVSIKDFKDFFNEQPKAGIEMKIKQSLESMKINSIFTRKSYKELSGFLIRMKRFLDEIALQRMNKKSKIKD